MTATPVWITAYGASRAGATAMYRSSAAGATQVQIVGYGGPPPSGIPSGVTPIWVSNAAQAGATAMTPVAYGGPLLSLPGSPLNTAAPSISGALTVGSTMTCNPGTWTGNPTITYAYQWVRNGLNISGATASTYVTVTADGGTSLTCKVTATNPVSSASAISNVLSIQGIPVNTAAPVASGTLTVGSTLSVTNGSWTNSPTYTYQWQRGGVNISGATASTYVTVTADGGTNVSCTVTATNAAGSASATSNTLAIVAGATGSTWSAADATTIGATLSNGGMTVTPPGVSGGRAIRGTISKSSGKWYVEFKNTVAATNWQFVLGFGNAGFNSIGPTWGLGESVYSGGAVVSTGNTLSAGFTGNYTPSGPDWQPAAGVVFGIAIDFAAGKIWISDNGVWLNSGNPATGAAPWVTFTPATVGALFPAMGFGGAGVGVWTLQPTAASQTYLPPPGFQAWDGGPVTPAASTWSAADAAASGATLSNGNMTVIATASGSNAAIRNTTSHSSGKWYFECKLSAAPGPFWFIGLLGVSDSVGGILGSTVNGAGFRGDMNNFGNSFTQKYGPTPNMTFAANDVIALAVDFNGGNIWIAQNNVWNNSSNPGTGSLPMATFVPATTGALEAAVTLYAGQTFSTTLQASAASQKYAPPAGFSPWDGGGSTTTTPQTAITRGRRPFLRTGTASVAFIHRGGTFC